MGHRHPVYKPFSASVAARQPPSPLDRVRETAKSHWRPHTPTPAGGDKLALAPRDRVVHPPLCFDVRRLKKSREFHRIPHK